MIAFAAPGDNARPTPVWAAFILLWTFWLIANVATAPVVFLIMTPSLLEGETAGPQTMGLVIILTLYLMFSVFAACALIWVKVYERRGFASAGLIWRGAVGRYGRGLFWGAAFALGLILVGGLVAVLLPGPLNETVPDFSFEILLRPSTVLFFAVLTFGLLLQSMAEEIICRGWLLSSIAMHHGRVIGLVVSALFFGSLHIHFLFFGNIAAGLVALASVIFMGFMLGLYALSERSIAGAAGMHGAFNTLVFGFALAAILSTGQASGPLEGINAAYELSTQPKSLSAEGFVQGGLALLVSLFLWRRLRGKTNAQEVVSNTARSSLP